MRKSCRSLFYVAMAVAALLAIPAAASATPENAHGNATTALVDISPNDGDNLASGATVTVTGQNFGGFNSTGSLYQCEIEGMFRCSAQIGTYTVMTGTGFTTQVQVTQTFTDSTSAAHPVIDCGTTRCGVLAVSSAGGGPFASHHITFAGTPIADDDLDTIKNDDDNCPGVANPAQANHDGDAMGDLCDADDDNDLVLDTTDECPQVAAATANGCPAPLVPPPAGPVATGQRAAAVKKCKKKKGRARAKCLKKAKKLPA